MREWLRKARESKGMTKRQAADALGMTGCYYGFIEKGVRKKKMDIALITQISELFGLSIQEIADFENSFREEADETEV